MRKKSVFSILILILLLVSCLAACQTGGTGGDDVPTDPDPRAISIAIDATSVPSPAYAGDFDVTLLRLIIIYDNDETETKGVTMSMIDTADRNKFDKIGTYQIKVNYLNCTTRFTLNLLEKDPARHVLRVYGGRPVQINDVDLDDEIVVDGEYYEASYDEGTTVMLEWIPVSGYYFVRWTDNGAYVDSQSRTKVTMNADHTYRAYGEPVVNSVSFVTNCDTGIGARRTNVLYETDLPVLVKDGYVFDGWTTTAVTGDDAIDCRERKISFPYSVGVETVLYGTWRELGIEYLDYVNERTGSTGYMVADYVKNDREVSIPAIHNGQPVLCIAADAFLSASALERLYIPASVEVIEAGFARGCARLKAIEVDLTSRYYLSDDGVLFNDGGDELIAYPAGKLAAVYAPDAVKVIRNYAFHNAVVGGIELPSGVREIGDHAFDSVHLDYVSFAAVNPNETGFRLGCNLFNDNLSAILIESAYESAFANHAAMNAFADRFTDDPDDLGVIGINAARTLIYKEIFNENSENPTTTVEIIGADRSLASLLLPINLGYSVSSVGYKAFNGCIYLAEFSIPRESRLERILDGAFDGTPYLDSLTDGSIIANNILYKYLGGAETYVLPRTVTRIAENAFRGNTTLKHIDLSQNNDLRYIGAYAFYGCSSLTGDATAEAGLTLKRQLTAIGNYAFAYSGLRAVSLQNDSMLETVGEGAFLGCYYLLTAEIGSRTYELSDDAFLFCYSLQSYSVQSGNAVFSAFDGVLYFTSTGSAGPNVLYAYPAGRMAAEFNVANPGGSNPLNVTAIGNYAFFFSNIASLYIPASVTNISATAFYIPGLIGVRFEKINGGITYSDLFVKDDPGFGKFAPEYITVTDLTPEDTERSINTFFGNDYVLRGEKYRESKNTDFAVADGMIIRLESDYASVVRSARNIDELIIPGVVGGKNVTVAAPYSFMGYYLERLTLGEYTVTLKTASMSHAASLRHLYTVAGAPATVEAGCFGEAFDNGLYVYVPSNLVATYIESWGFADDRYLIDITGALPEARFAYRTGEEAESIDPIRGQITPDRVPKPHRQGYIFGGWTDEDGNMIDFTETWIIPYNITLFCSWEPMRYTVNFNIGSATMTGETSVTVAYGSVYNFENPVYPNNSKKLLYWRTANNTRIEPTGEWSYLGEEIIDLYPVWEDVRYILIFDASDPSVQVEGEREIVLYGQTYQLPVPVKDGYVFRGWSLSPDADGALITDAQGNSLLPWEISVGEEFAVYSKWVVKTDIKVNLYFKEGELYRTVTVVYGQEFSFDYDDNFMNEEWAAKADLFCGWYDAYDYTAHSGTGTRYTDETGKGLFGWDKGADTDLYAQWPLEISSGEELENLSDMSRSVVLTGDVTVTKPIGSGASPYTGTFNGAGHTVTFNYVVEENAPSFDGYAGLFAYNKGTVKNFKLIASIEVRATSALRSPLYVGAVAGYNEGKIVSVDQTGYDVTADISVNVSAALTPSAHIGGIVGYNAGGTLLGAGMLLNSLTVTVDGAPYDASAHSRTVSCGTVVGTLNGGLFDAQGRGFSYYYRDDADPFVSAVCGDNKLGDAINIGVSSSKVRD